MAIPGRSTVPYRHDAVAATVALLHHLESIWLQQEDAGADLVVTSGELFTDPAMHGPSKIAGETHFVLDLRSVSDVTMNAVATDARQAAARIGEAYRVAFDLGATSDSPPAVMDSRLRASPDGPCSNARSKCRAVPVTTRRSSRNRAFRPP